MKYVFSTSSVIAALVLVFSGSALAGLVDTGVYGVTVDSNITITAPAGDTITHSATDANQAFTAQSWTVACNNATGGTVNFAVSAPFTHGTVSTYEADVLLSLSIDSNDPTWTVSTATDQTDYAGTDDAATVTATSTAAGDAVFSLAVTFVQADYSILAAGTYSVTVTGTVASN